MKNTPEDQAGNVEFAPVQLQASKAEGVMASENPVPAPTVGLRIADPDLNRPEEAVELYGPVAEAESLPSLINSDRIAWLVRVRDHLVESINAIIREEMQ